MAKRPCFDEANQLSNEPVEQNTFGATAFGQSPRDCTIEEGGGNHAGSTTLFPTQGWTGLNLFIPKSQSSGSIKTTSGFWWVRVRFSRVVFTAVKLARSGRLSIATNNALSVAA